MILGGSSGFGLATAHKLAEHGMNLCVVHRDRRAQLARIEPEFEKLRGHGGQVLTINADALDADKRAEILDQLATALGARGPRARAAALGRLRQPEAARRREGAPAPARRRARRAGRDPSAFRASAWWRPPTSSSRRGSTSCTRWPRRRSIRRAPFSTPTTSRARSTAWARACSTGRRICTPAACSPATRASSASPARATRVAWKGYAAVSAAKVALEAVARSIAVEFAPHGVRCNVIQAGVTETPALAAIPGSAVLKAQARLRNPFGRLTQPARRRERDLPALARRRRLDQRRGDPRRRRRAHLGGHLVTLFLHGLGHFHPENEITNRFLEELDIGTNDEWILERVGHPLAAHGAAARLHPHHAQPGRARRRRGDALHHRRARPPRGGARDRARRASIAPRSAW